MAEGKKGFILYADQKELFDQLSDQKAGILIKHVFKYVNDENPISKDMIINLAFTPIKQQLKRDLKHWEEKKDNYSNAGKESGKARRLIAKDQLYVLRFYSENEEFIKVGVTMNSIGRRYSSDGEGGAKVGYKFDVLFQLFQSDIKNFTVVQVEQSLHKKLHDFKYNPRNKFGGHSECFRIDCLKIIEQHLTSLNNVQQRSTKRTVNDNVNVKVNDTVNVNDIINGFDFNYKDELTNYVKHLIESHNRSIGHMQIEQTLKMLDSWYDTKNKKVLCMAQNIANNWKTLNFVDIKNDKNDNEFKFLESWQIKKLSPTEYQDFKKEAIKAGWKTKRIPTTGQTSFEKDGKQVII